MKYNINEVKIGDEVLIKDEYDDNKSIINKIGTVIDNDGEYLTIFFHENIEGHNASKPHKFLESFAKKYNTYINNCWNFDINECCNIIEPIKNNIGRIKYDLYVKANITK